MTGAIIAAAKTVPMTSAVVLVIANKLKVVTVPVAQPVATVALVMERARFAGAALTAC
jgi:hypothetical protein